MSISILCSQRGRIAATIVLSASVGACGGGGDGGPNPLDVLEQNAVAQFNKTPISVRGRVINGDGTAVPAAQIRIDQQQVASAQDGSFAVTNLSRKNALMEISAPGMRPALVPLHLYRSVAITEVGVDPVVLTPRDPGTVRFLFTGDTGFGRRFLDTDDSTPRGQLPPDDPAALIQATNPLPGSRAALAYMRPVFDSVDYRSMNFESPITSNPVTPHPTKEFVFFSLPGSVPALREVGINHVNLGNNHLYDYLDAGLVDTLRFIDEAGIGRSGAGREVNEAFAPFRVDLGGTPYSFLGMTSINGFEHPISYVATPTKGGAADLNDEARVRNAFNAERAAGRVPIAVLHPGFEYAEQPSARVLSLFRQTISSGAKLVIAHHPHVAQGFSRFEGVLIAHSLGNFLFDQDRLETMLGLLAQVDMAGDRVSRADGIPIYLEDYRPRLIAGPLADRLLRRIGVDSRDNGVTVMPYNSRGIVLGENETADTQERELVLQATISDKGWGVLDLRDQLRSGESVAAATPDRAGIRLVAGRDQLDHGDFEDQDIDEQAGEALRWDINGRTSHTCLHAPRSGAAALCSRRDSRDARDAVVALRNRVRVVGDPLNQPNKNLTLYGWVRGDNAGRVSIVSRYFASEGTAEFGEELSVSRPGGQYGWETFADDLAMPPDTDPAGAGLTNARAVRVFLRQSPPESGSGLASFDDLAIINWEPETAGTALQLPTPNIRDFIRVEGPPGSVSVRVVLRRQRPSYAAR